MPISTLELILSLITTLSISWGIWQKRQANKETIAAGEKVDDKRLETHRTDAMAAAATEQFNQWKAIVETIKAERADVVARYTRKSEQLIEATATIGELKQQVFDLQQMQAKELPK